jgi:hypothetical protein
MGELRSYRLQPDTSKSIRFLSRKLHLFEGEIVDLAIICLREKVVADEHKGR